MFSVGRRDVSVVITEYHLGTLTDILDLNITFLNVIQTPIGKMSYPSNALVSSPSTTWKGKPSLIPVSPTESVKGCGDRGSPYPEGCQTASSGNYWLCPWLWLYLTCTNKVCVMLMYVLSMQPMDPQHQHHPRLCTLNGCLVRLVQIYLIPHLLPFNTCSFIPEAVRPLQDSCSVNTKWGTGLFGSPGFSAQPE